MKQSVVCILFFLLMPAVLLASSSANSENDVITVKVLQSQTVPLKSDSNTVIQGCNGADYSASCNHSTDNLMQNMMVVQSEDGKKFTIACTVENRWSGCVALPEGESFRARVGKSGISVAYVDNKGRPRKHEFRVLPEGAFAASAATK